MLIPLNKEVGQYLERRKRMMAAAMEYGVAITELDTVRECGVFGSLATEDIYPVSMDLIVVVDGLDNLEGLAARARRITFQNWVVILLTEKLDYLGHVCYYRTCPAGNRECETTGCGKPPRRMVLPDWKFERERFLTSPYLSFYASGPESAYARWRRELGITDVRPPVRLAPVRKTCVDCGMKFVWSVAEQKLYSARGLCPPKRCDHCRGQRW